MAEEPDSGAEGSISRTGIELVIRRAIDLSLSQQEAKEEISEAELIKIGEELGLSPRHVRQAIYERGSTEPEPASFLDRNFGPTSITVARAVPCEVVGAQRRLEDYLVTREYLQIRRRQGVNALFEPADDAFSSIARIFNRPSSRYSLARVQRAYLTVRPLEADWCHVRLELSYPERRSSHVIGAAVGGGLVGAAVGSATTLAVGLAMGGFTGAEGLTALVSGALAGGSSFAGMWALIRASYRKWIARTKDEADAILDRLEHGEDLRPPASPWMRRLQQKLRGFGPRPH